MAQARGRRPTALMRTASGAPRHYEHDAPEPLRETDRHLVSQVNLFVAQTRFCVRCRTSRLRTARLLLPASTSAAKAAVKAVVKIAAPIVWVVGVGILRIGRGVVDLNIARLLALGGGA
jgi:hypothetical protein